MMPQMHSRDRPACHYRAVKFAVTIVCAIDYNIEKPAKYQGQVNNSRQVGSQSPIGTANSMRRSRR